MCRRECVQSSKSIAPAALLPLPKAAAVTSKAEPRSEITCQPSPHLAFASVPGSNLTNSIINATAIYPFGLNTKTAVGLRSLPFSTISSHSKCSSTAPTSHLYQTQESTDHQGPTPKPRTPPKTQQNPVSGTSTFSSSLLTMKPPLQTP